MAETAPSRPEGDAPSSASATTRPTVRWLEPLALTVLCIATVATAWSAYQATRWSGEMANSYSAANAYRAESIEAATLAGQDHVIDVQSFIAWSEAVAAGDAAEAAYFRARFRPEFEVAFSAWVQRPPGTTTDVTEIPPGTPFDDYRPSGFDDGDELAEQADAAAQTARVANQHGDNYVLTTVFLALVLFLAGLAPRFSSQRLGAAIAVAAGAMGVLGVLLLALQPVNVGL